jgi:hypothetical protein
VRRGAAGQSLRPHLRSEVGVEFVLRLQERKLGVRSLRHAQPARRVSDAATRRNGERLAAPRPRSAFAGLRRDAPLLKHLPVGSHKGGRLDLRHARARSGGRRRASRVRGGSTGLAHNAAAQRGASSARRPESRTIALRCASGGIAGSAGCDIAASAPSDGEAAATPQSKAVRAAVASLATMKRCVHHPAVAGGDERCAVLSWHAAATTGWTTTGGAGLTPAALLACSSSAVMQRFYRCSPRRRRQGLRSWATARVDCSAQSWEGQTTRGCRMCPRRVADASHPALQSLRRRAAL